MIESPLGLLEIDNEVFITNAPEFCQTQFGKTPEALLRLRLTLRAACGRLSPFGRFNPIDVIFSASKLVAMMMNAVMFISAHRSSSIHRCRRWHLPLDNRHQLLLGAVPLQSGVKTFPPRFSSPITGVFPLAPRLRLPLTRPAPK